LRSQSAAAFDESAPRSYRARGEAPAPYLDTEAAELADWIEFAYVLNPRGMVIYGRSRGCLRVKANVLWNSAEPKWNLL
jgi:hypothetical protein